MIHILGRTVIQSEVISLQWKEKHTCVCLRMMTPLRVSTVPKITKPNPNDWSQKTSKGN